MLRGNLKFVRLLVNGAQWELNYRGDSVQRLKNSASEKGRYLAVLTENTGKIPVRFVTEGGKRYLRSNVKGIEYELSYTNLDSKNMGAASDGLLTNNRRFAVWTYNTGKHPVGIVGSGASMSIQSIVDGETMELSWTSIIPDANKRKTMVWNPRLGAMKVVIE